MMRTGLRFAAAAAAVLVATVGNSQEGFPLDGTWRGEWGTAGEPGNHVVIVMKWNGSSLTGRINPGPNSIDFDAGRLDATDWGVHIEAQTRDGEAIRIDGTLSNIGSYNRSVAGTWEQGGVQYAFTITRE